VFCDATTAAQLTACVIHPHAAETLGLSDLSVANCARSAGIG
jgi:hypothetical protein